MNTDTQDIHTQALETSQPIVLFDGVCNLCNDAVQTIIKRDKKQQFLFASLQSEAGQALLKKFDRPLDDFDSKTFKTVFSTQ
jgi:predicted DCC family thiol-disulfide oxidoreductase YuxK